MSDLVQVELCRAPMAASCQDCMLTAIRMTADWQLSDASHPCCELLAPAGRQGQGQASFSRPSWACRLFSAGATLAAVRTLRMPVD